MARINFAYLLNKRFRISVTPDLYARFTAVSSTTILYTFTGDAAFSIKQNRKGVYRFSLNTIFRFVTNASE